MSAACPCVTTTHSVLAGTRSVTLTMTTVLSVGETVRLRMGAVQVSIFTVTQTIEH